MWKKQQREKLKTARFPANWSRVLEERFPLYARLPVEDRKELQAHIQVFLAEKRFEGCGGLEIAPVDEYGATNPAEFFAVATESFFERPCQMQRRHPELYEELKRFYRQDPAGWPSPQTGAQGSSFAAS